MAWYRPGNKPLSETMLVDLLTHICVIQHQWVKTQFHDFQSDNLYVFCKQQPTLVFSLYVSIPYRMQSTSHTSFAISAVPGLISSITGIIFLSKSCNGSLNRTGIRGLFLYSFKWHEQITNCWFYKDFCLFYVSRQKFDAKLFITQR